jgi:hypothetical protein
MLLTIVVYIYTVIAFNFFRKFYVSEEEEEVDQKCHDMLTVGTFSLISSSKAKFYHFLMQILVFRVPSVQRCQGWWWYW